MAGLVNKGAFCIASVRAIPISPEKKKLISVIPRKRNALCPVPNRITATSLLQSSPWHTACTASCGLGIPSQIRFTHTDVTKVPDFTDYRHGSTRSPTVKTVDSEIQRKVFSYTMMFAGTVLATTAAKYSIKTFILPLGPTAKTLAEASTEVNLAAIPEGKNLVVKWRNKPLFIRHRSAAEVARERAVPLSSLRHPERDEDRVQQDKWLICLGVCTHLGCVPIAHAGDIEGGYYCPCHGSHYDASGRIRKGPAPLNLEVPEYKFVDDSTVIVG